MGSDEGALERFLASALATILTLIFSWHIIIDVYDDNKSRRQRAISDVTSSSNVNSDVATSSNVNSDVTPSANVSTASLSRSNNNNNVPAESRNQHPVASSVQGCQNNLPAQHVNSSAGVVREYKLTPGTLSRLEAVPDPIDIITPSACKQDAEDANNFTKNETFDRVVVQPVLSDRSLPELDSVDLKLVNRDVSRVLEQSRDLIPARASPDDFDSVPLYADDASPSPVNDVTNVTSEDNAGKPVKTFRKVGKFGQARTMFDESWDMDPADGDFQQIYGDEDVDRQNPRDYFFVPVDYEDSSEDEVDNYWHRRILEAISEEDEDDLSSSCHSSSEDDRQEDEEDRFSDDSLNLPEKSAVDEIENSNQDKNSSSIMDNDSLSLKDDSSSLDKNSSSLYKNADQNSDLVKPEFDLVKTVMDTNTQDLNSNQLPEENSTLLQDSYFDFSPSKNVNVDANLDDDVIARERGCHGNWNHDQHHHQEDEGGEVAEGKLAPGEEPEMSAVQGLVLTMDSESDSRPCTDRFSPSSPVLNERARHLCLSFDGLNTLEPSLSSTDHSGIVGRASLTDLTMSDRFSTNGDLTINLSNFDDSKLEYLEDSYRDCDLSDCSKPAPRGFIFSQSQELESKSEIVSSNFVPREKNEDLCPSSAAPGAAGDKASCGVSGEKQNGGDQYSTVQTWTDLNFKSPTVETDSVYVIDLKQDYSEVSQEVRTELLAQEQILDSKINSENSSGDESSTTTGDTAILNPANREITDDDASEISEIDPDVIKELQLVASEPFSGNKRQVTDLDASSSESEHSDDNSDSSASFEFNKEEDSRPEIPNRNRNLEVLDELEEEELSTSDSSEEFQDAHEEPARKFSLEDLASSGSGSSPEEAVITPHDSVTPSENHPNLLGTDSTERHIVKRQRAWPDMASVPEVGFFHQPEVEERGTQTVRSYRQPAVCTIDPERYFKPFSLDAVGFDVITEYNTGEVEVRRFVDVGVQVKFDPLWDKTEQQLVLSPRATPTRGSPVTVEGKLQPKELVFQWPDKEDTTSNENVFANDNFDPNFDVMAVQRKRRASSERRPSYDAIDESEEDMLEDAAQVLASPPKSAEAQKTPEVVKGEFGDDVMEATVVSCKVFEQSSDEEESEMPKTMDNETLASVEKPQVKEPRRGFTEILSSTEISSKYFDGKSSSSEGEQEQELHRSPPKRKRKSPSKTPKRHSTRNSSSDEERLVVERVHIEDSSDADDENDEARVPLMAKSDQSPLMSPSSPPTAPVEAFIEPITRPGQQHSPPGSSSPRKTPSPSQTSPRRVQTSPSRVHISPRPRPVPAPRVKPMDFISSKRVSPIELKSAKPLYTEFNQPDKGADATAVPKPVVASVPPMGHRTSSTSVQPIKSRISPTEPTKSNVEAAKPTMITSEPFKRNVAPTEPQKPFVTSSEPSKSIKNVPEPRKQSALTIELKSTSRPAPMVKTEARINGPTTGKKSTETSPTHDAKPDQRYSSVLTEPVTVPNRNISHLYTLPDKTALPEREKINSARQEYLKKQEQSNEEERKKLLSRLLGTRDWSERDMPKPKSILKKPQSFTEHKPEDLPIGYKPTSLDTPNLAKLCKSTENIKDRISRVVERRKEEDRERSRSRSNSRSEFDRSRPERHTLPANFRSAPSRAKSLDSLMDNKSLSLPRTDSSGSLYRSPSITLNTSLSGFFSDRKSYTNLLETDLDSENVKVVPLVKETDLDEVAKTTSSRALNRIRSKSETRSSYRPVIKEVYNDTLEKTKSLEQLSENKTISLTVYDTPEVVPVQKDSNRLSKSLGQLDLPDWYVNAPRKPEDVDFGLICTKTPPSSTSTSFDHSKSFRSNTSFDSPRSTVIPTRVSPPRRTPSPKPAKPFELPSERFRRGHVPMASRKIVSKMRPPGSKSMDDLSSKDMKVVEISDLKLPNSESLSQVSNEKEMPKDIGKIEKEVATDVKTKLDVDEKKPERFTSSATVQLKPAPPPKPVVKPPIKPVTTSKLVETTFDAPVIKATPVETTFDSPVMEVKPMETTFDSPIKKAEPVETTFGAPVMTAKPMETTFDAPIKKAEPMETTFDAPVMKAKPVETTFDSPIKKPVETAIDISPTKEVSPVKRSSFESHKTAPQRVRPVAAPPAPPQFPLTPPEVSEVKPEVPEPVAPKISAGILDIPFVDESPQDEEPKFKLAVKTDVQTYVPTARPAFMSSPENENAPLVKETTLEAEPEPYQKAPESDTYLRLQDPVVQAACQPHQPKSFTTTPTQFYSLNVIETDLDTSATNSTRRSHESLNDFNSGSEGSERKWAPPEVSVGAPTRPSYKPPLVQTSTDTSPRFQRDDVTPRSPRETSFVSKPSPKLDSNPSSPRETSFLSKGKERTHFVFPKPVAPSSDATSSSQETNVDDLRPPPKRPTDFGATVTVPIRNNSRRDDVITSQNAPRLQTFQRPAPPMSSFQKQVAPSTETLQRHPVVSLETSIDSPPVLRRHERYPPKPEPSPIAPVAQRDANIDYKTSTPIVRNQNYGPRGPPRMSRETDLDADIIQQPRSPPSQFERSLDNDSFRFNAPQSESTPLNLSLESNSSHRAHLKPNRPVLRSRETNIDSDLPQRPPPRQTAPPIPYRPPRAPPPAPPGTNHGPVPPPRQSNRETDIDADLNNGPYQPRTVSRPATSRSSVTSRPSLTSRPGSVTSQTGSLSDGYFEPEVDLATFKRMAREDPLVSTSSPRASPLDAKTFGAPNHAPGAPSYGSTPDAPNYIAPGAPPAVNTFGTNVRIDHSQSVYQPRAEQDSESPHNTSLVEVLDGLLGMDQSPRTDNSDDFTDTQRKRVVSEAKFDVFNDINRRLNEDLTLIKCRNSRCGKTLPLRQARTVYVTCTLCYSYYCSDECRSYHYPRHEERCTFSRVDNSCRLVARRVVTDTALSQNISYMARNGYQTLGRGCILIVFDSPLQCDKMVNSGQSAVQLNPIFIPLYEIDSNPKVSDNAMDLIVDYNPNSNFILNICCQITRRRTEFVRYCELVSLRSLDTPVIAVNERLPRDRWFSGVQEKLRERGVDLRQQYPDVYNQIVQYVEQRTRFQTITIYPVDRNSGKTFLCSISPDLPVDVRPMTWTEPQFGRQNEPVDNNRYAPNGASAQVNRQNAPVDNRYAPGGGRGQGEDKYAPVSGRAPVGDKYAPTPVQRAPLDNRYTTGQRAPASGQNAPQRTLGPNTGAQRAPLGAWRAPQQGRPMYQPPRRGVPNPASKETEL